MAKKRRKAPNRAMQMQMARARNEATPLIEQAVRMLERGNADRALQLGQQAAPIATSEQEKRAVNALLAESHFRQAAKGEYRQQLYHLQAAVEAQPEEGRFHFHRAILLWRMGRLDEADAALERAVACDPQRPKVAYLRHLLAVSRGASMPLDGLTAEEATTIEFLAAFPTRKKEGQEALAAQAPTLYDPLLSLGADSAVSEQARLTQARKEAPADLRGLYSYYLGLSEMRANRTEAATTHWRDAEQAGYESPWLQDNLAALFRNRAIALANAGEWEALTRLDLKTPDGLEDRILNQTLMHAYFELGHRAAEKGAWSEAVKQWRKAQAVGSDRLLAQNLALAEEALGNQKAAAEAWREMVRRRPRKADHPDYLSEAQVAVIWRHVADRYQEIDETEEEIVCLRNAIKYAEGDVELRQRLVDSLIHNEQEEAAYNEVERLLERFPDHVGLLSRLGALQMNQWGSNPIPTWQRLLTLDPSNEEGRIGLRDAYMHQLQRLPIWRQEAVNELFDEAVKWLGEDATLLNAWGNIVRDRNEKEAAQALYLRAVKASRITDVGQLGNALHELVHLEAYEAVEEAVEIACGFSQVRPTFWIIQGRMALDCGLGERWVERFFDQAILNAQTKESAVSTASVLVDIYEELPNDATVLNQRYEQRIRDEVPESGAVEYVKALKHYGDSNSDQALRWLHKAGRKAKKQKDAALLRLIAEFEEAITLPQEMPMEILSRLMELFPDGPPSIEALESLPDEFFEEFL
ncbi:MAG: hypothetical protein KDD73_12570 [Anaerolineales bacterium]|nr:hypothetical protein [Anaerolineales bacterium]MCB9126416.1 hypothetical protein [Ardenticatenales bacterium]MCB9171577.1 hypothetical protein [Ardenticatenales bacterium]